MLGNEISFVWSGETSMWNIHVKFSIKSHVDYSVVETVQKYCFKMNLILHDAQDYTCGILESGMNSHSIFTRLDI